MVDELGSILNYSDDLADAEAPSALPAGDYPAQIVKTELKSQSADPSKSSVGIHWLIKPEDYPADYADGDSYPEGKTVRQYLSAEQDKNSRFRMRKFCEGIGVPLTSSINIEDWVGKSAILTLGKARPFQDIMQENISKVSPA